MFYSIHLHVMTHLYDKSDGRQRVICLFWCVLVKLNFAHCHTYCGLFSLLYYPLPHPTPLIFFYHNRPNILDVCWSCYSTSFFYDYNFKSIVCYFILKPSRLTLVTCDSLSSCTMFTDEIGKVSTDTIRSTFCLVNKIEMEYWKNDCLCIAPVIKLIVINLQESTTSHSSLSHDSE